ncbi:MAG: hypothetical protein SVR04_00150 [Spirochaetota bacterium]|nr:hypothetical protein [Spirochaetota bacterium]
MTALFYTVRCRIIMPDKADDYETMVDIPGGMSQGETLRFWAELEDRLGAVEVRIVDEKLRRLWWRTD